jgi:biotin carboxyl carrier protein
MAIDIQIGDREAHVRLIQKDGTKATLDVDGITYDVDIVMVEEGVYSILHEGKSYNIEMIPGNSSKNYYVNTYSSSHEVEIIDAQSRYQKSRNNGSVDSTEKIITTPMPGKVVRIPVHEGQEVEKGATVIVISAMKMESDYRAPIDGKIKRIFVKEGDSINGNQPLIEIE